MAGMQFVVSGDSMAARDLVLGVFSQCQWRVALKNDWEATAEHGSKAASFWGGAFAGKGGRHVVLSIKVSADPQGNTVIGLTEIASGFSGGVIGVTQAQDVYQEMYNNVGIALSNAGIFVSNSRT
ncbi:MAG: hypothetical protein FWE69_07380 [Clostridiales bacterium]|nr:hypothetical protein [Clostridiales bacterium]